METCASIGGVLMPPMMVATAFVMVSFWKVSDVSIVAAAAAPSRDVFFGLFVQITSYAARIQLDGMDTGALPKFKETLRHGWRFLALFILLLWMLVYLEQAAAAPFYATALLLLADYFAPGERWKKRQ